MVFLFCFCFVVYVFICLFYVLVYLSFFFSICSYFFLCYVWFGVSKMKGCLFGVISSSSSLSSSSLLLLIFCIHIFLLRVCPFFLLFFLFFLFKVTIYKFKYNTLAKNSRIILAIMLGKNIKMLQNNNSIVERKVNVTLFEG